MFGFVPSFKRTLHVRSVPVFLDKLSFILARLSSMEFMVIIMHITTQQMKGIFLLLDAVRVILEIAACAGKLKGTG